MPRVVYPELGKMARILGRELNKDPVVFRKTILKNVKHLIENIPPEELVSIFEED